MREATEGRKSSFLFLSFVFSTRRCKRKKSYFPFSSFAREIKFGLARDQVLEGVQYLVMRNEVVEGVPGTSRRAVTEVKDFEVRTRMRQIIQIRAIICQSGETTCGKRKCTVCIRSAFRTASPERTRKARRRTKRQGLKRLGAIRLK